MSGSSGDIGARKRDHLRLALDGDVGFTATTSGFERLRLRHRALPERDLADVALQAVLLGWTLRAPLLISCMTGGVAEAGPVNRALAAAAQAHGVAVGLGSGRVLLEHPEAEGFGVRDLAPDVPLLANLGAVQLHRYGVDGCGELVERCQADALVLHCNPVQEAVQPGGDTDFAGVADRIAAVAADLPVPVLVKEVGFGLSAADVEVLVDAGVAGVDVAGAGGTNWAHLEGRRDARAQMVAAAFAEWGLPTVAALRQARAVLDRRGARHVALLASGGVRDGVDATKALCLGADAAALGRALLDAAAEGPTAAVERLGVVLEQMRVAVWATGAAGVADLRPGLLVDDAE